MTAKLLLALALMATTAGAGWAAPIKPEVPAVAKFHEAMTGTVKPEMIPKEEEIPHINLHWSRAKQQLL